MNPDTEQINRDEILWKKEHAAAGHEPSTSWSRGKQGNHSAITMLTSL